MGKLDLSKTADFNRLTEATINNLSGLFGLQAGQWDLLEGAYQGGRPGAKRIIFHVFKSKLSYNGALSRVSDFGGRRKVKYQFPYKDGQTTDDLGRKPQTFELEIVLFGENYLNALDILEEEFNDPIPGTLTHPLRGHIDCAVDEVTVTHQSDQRKAAALRVTFMEHNFTMGDIRIAPISSFKSLLSGALAVFQTIDAIDSAIEGAVLMARGIKNLIHSYLAVYRRDTASVLTRMNQTFNSKGSTADIPTLTPTNQGGTGTSTNAGGATNRSGTIANRSTFQTVRSVSDPFNNVPVSDLTSSEIPATAVPQIIKSVQALRDQATLIITTIETAPAVQSATSVPGVTPALELFDSVEDLRGTVLLMQQALEAGIASSNASVIDFTVPRLMSIREIAFAVGISPERSQEIDVLNPQLLSVNFVPVGTILKVPAA